jgi:tRNA(adenine34) deaminase
MCAGASYWTQISKIVFGAFDEKRGFTLTNPKMLHPKTELVSGVMQLECSAILKKFFKKKRF